MGFVVLTVDIKKSTELSITSMSSVISEINKLLNELNRLPEVHSTGITTGDEFDIVLRTPRILFKVIYLIRYKLTVEYRIGIALGRIENPSIRTPSQMWGSAFTRAREALNIAKEKDGEIIFFSPNNKFNKQINIVLDLLILLRKKMTDKQKSIYDKFNYFKSFENLKLQTELADKINVSDAMISKTLKKIGYNKILKGEKLVASMITEFFEKQDDLT